MALTLGSGPWSGDRQGSSADPLPDHALFLQPVGRRVRAEFASTTVLQSDRVQSLHETGRMPQWYLPLDDVVPGILVHSDTRRTDPHKGEASYWHLVVGDRTAKDAAWTYRTEGPHAPDGLAGLVGFRNGKLDRWFEEDQELLGHPRDPFHRVDTRRSSRTVEVHVDGHLVARTSHPLAVFETSIPVRWYLPREDVLVPLTASATPSVCPYKGVASYWSLAGRPDAAWSYEEPLGEALDARGMVCFDGEGFTITVTG